MLAPILMVVLGVLGIAVLCVAAQAVSRPRRPFPAEPIRPALPSPITLSSAASVPQLVDAAELRSLGGDCQPRDGEPASGAPHDSLLIASTTDDYSTAYMQMTYYYITISANGGTAPGSRFDHGRLR